eukprot:182785-Pyramimonas_sp.AAC.2
MLGATPSADSGSDSPSWVSIVCSAFTSRPVAALCRFPPLIKFNVLHHDVGQGGGVAGLLG